MTDRIRWAWIVCPQCDGDFDFRMQNEDGVPLQCPWCTEGKIKAKLIRVAKGSAARGGGYKTSRTTPDIKFSKAHPTRGEG